MKREFKWLLVTFIIPMALLIGTGTGLHKVSSTALASCSNA
jgi:hypothetical protein